MNVKKILKTAGIALLSWSIPLLTFANQVQSGLSGSGLSGVFGTSGIGGSRNVNQLITNVIRILLGVAGAIAVLFVLIGGFMYLTAGGNDEQAEKGRKYLTNAVIGIVIIVLSYVIVTVVVSLVSGTGSIF